MTTPGIPINLAAADMPVIAMAGDDVYLPFTVVDTITTGWTSTFTIWRANQSGNGPVGDAIGTGTVVNTPGTPDSAMTVTVAGAVTANYSGQTLWAVFKRTNAGQIRTLANGKWSIR